MTVLALLVAGVPALLFLVCVALMVRRLWKVKR